MVNKIFVFLLFLFVSYNNFANEKSFQEIELICVTKLKMIDWVLNYANDLPLDTKLNIWEREYKKINLTYPTIFTHTTKIDVERIIRESERRKEKLKNIEQKQKFIDEEIKWCLYYKH